MEKKKFYKKVTLGATKDIITILNKKINGAKIQDTIVFAKKGNDF